MLKNSENSFKTADSPEEYGVILGCWDHEKTPTIIRELEDSVNLVDKKCKKLMQHLIYYKQYWEECNKTSNFINYPTLTKNGKKTHKTQNFKSNSAPNICLVKNILNSQELEKLFQNMCKKKLSGINKALSDASRKIGLKENIILLPNKHCLQTTEKKTAGILKKSLSQIHTEFLKDCVAATAKSDTCIPNIEESADGSHFTKITQNEWKMYQKFSKINYSKKPHKKRYRKINKKKILSSPHGKINLKLKKLNAKNYVLENCTKKKSPKRQSKFSASTLGKAIEAKIDDKKFKTTRKHRNNFKIFRENTSKKFVSEEVENLNSHKTHSNCGQFLQPRSSQASHDTASFHPNKFDKDDSEIELICSNILEAIHKKNQLKQSYSNPKNLTEELRASCSSYVKKVMPFTSCSSTSRSFNVWMNLQHFLSLKKYGKKTCLKKFSNSKNFETENKNSQTFEANNEISDFKESRPQENTTINSRYTVTTYPWNYGETNCNFERQEINRVERNEKVWITNHSSAPSDRKFRSKYTRTTPETFMEYHKSTTKQYTNGQESLIRSESKTAYTVGTKIMVSDCQRTNFYGIKKESLYNNASGDSTLNAECTKLKIKWDRVYTSLSALYRKYSALKIEAAKNDLNPSNAAIKSLETEIDFAIEKYKEFLKIYSKFLQLKTRLESMKIACDTTAYATTSTLDQFRRADIKRVTYSMVLKETFKKVQNLQEQIKQINNC